MKKVVLAVCLMSLAFSFSGLTMAADLDFAANGVPKLLQQSRQSIEDYVDQMSSDDKIDACEFKKLRQKINSYRHQAKFYNWSTKDDVRLATYDSLIDAHRLNYSDTKDEVVRMYFWDRSGKDVVVLERWPFGGTMLGALLGFLALAFIWLGFSTYSAAEGSFIALIVGFVALYVLMVNSGNFIPPF